MRIVPIKGFYGYFVTDTGKVFNSRGHEMRPYLNRRTGYFQIVLRYAPNKAATRYVHRLVAGAFMPNHAGLCEVNHIDGNKQNNLASNLEWTNKSGNACHAYQIGLRPTVRVTAYTLDGKLCRTFPSVKEAMAFCGVSYNAGISNCLTGKAATAHGYIWKYTAGGAEP
jgi:hypothetical protein